MSRAPCPQETHHLRIDIDFDRILTINFPHSSWANVFLDHLESRRYHEDSRARLDDAYTVSMKLPKYVDRIHVGLSTGASEGGAVALVFDDLRGVREWLGNAPLWEQSRAGDPSGERSAVIRTGWAHVDFEGRMGMHRGRMVVAATDVLPGRELMDAPLVGGGVGVLGPAVDPYSTWRRERMDAPRVDDGVGMLGPALDPYLRKPIRKFGT
jgi:hypothetical protein